MTSYDFTPIDTYGDASDSAAPEEETAGFVEATPDEPAVKKAGRPKKAADTGPSDDADDADDGAHKASSRRSGPLTVGQLAKLLRSCDAKKSSYQALDPLSQTAVQTLLGEVKDEAELIARLHLAKSGNAAPAELALTLLERGRDRTDIGAFLDTLTEIQRHVRDHLARPRKSTLLQDTGALLVALGVPVKPAYTDVVSLLAQSWLDPAQHLTDDTYETLVLALGEAVAFMK